jgi:hypothetical protein
MAIKGGLRFLAWLVSLDGNLGLDTVIKVKHYNLLLFLRLFIGDVTKLHSSFEP